ncbi:hypothetical protein WAF17_16465 [Bernardetia sp. ABR2-2B]|uniref:hypothetical protein n=1 Tax=Bernardetia sp. ABR2-2B TaxID=3127472 RepID=UPI0030CB5D71
MAQKRHIEYLSDDISFQFNEFLIGIIPPGLYRGFEFTPNSNLFLQLSHQNTGYSFPKKDGSISSTVGVVRSKQGVLVIEDAPISLQVSANTTSNPRIDLVVCEHKYEEIAGGLDAEYFLIEGTPNTSPVAPTLTNTNFQVVIGELYLPANTSTLDTTGVVYTRSSLPELGNNNLQEQLLEILDDFIVLQGNFDTLQGNFNTLNQEMIDWRVYYQPQMRFDGVNIQWKWAGEAETEWKNLMQGIAVNASGPGTMEVRILEAQYLPNAEVWNVNTPEQRDHNVLEFNTQTSLPVGATYWINNREWIAPQTKDYNFLLDTLKLVCFKDVDYTDIDANAESLPFRVYPSIPNDVSSWLRYNANQPNPNGFIRIELVKNNVVEYTLFHKFNLEDGTVIGDEILLPVIDLIISAEAGDAFTWRMSIQPNFNNIDEQMLPINSVPSQLGFEIIRQANTAFLQKEHFQIESGHWTIFGG